VIDSPAGADRESTTQAKRPPRARQAEFGWFGLGLALVAYAVLAYGYLSLTPVWQNPDEPAHYNYVAFVAETGGLPELRQGDWDSALLERLKNGTLEPGDSIAAIRYESWQPPLLYLLAAPVYRLEPTGDPAQVLPRLRALDAVFGAITLVVAYFVARHVFEPGLAAAVPLAMVGVPMFVAVSTALSADPLANLLAAAILLALLEWRGGGWGWSLLVGALLGLGLLTKLELGIFVPIALGVIALRSSRKVRDGAVVLIVTGSCVLPWLVHQVTTYGWTDPLAVGRHAQVVADQPRFPGFSLDWLTSFLTVSFHSFWAQFGWMGIAAPVRLYAVWGVVAIAALVGLVLGRRRLLQPNWLLMLATVLIACVAYVGYNLAFEQFQARYVFTALTPIAALLVLGWSALTPRRVLPWAVLLLTVGLIALNAYALTRVLAPGFAPL
jgi:4-amino-4-deoxy-L-arabinose transferase-like glycosyltransferase